MQFLQIPSSNTEDQNQYRQVQVTLPINRLGQRKGKVVIIEVLKVFWALPGYPGGYSTPGQIAACQAQLSTTSQSNISNANSTVFAYTQRSWKGSNAGGPEASSDTSCTWTQPEVTDLTDGAGHGILIATDTIFFGFDTDSYPEAGVTFSARIYYRFKEVDLTEYIGIVQQQSVTQSTS